MSYQPFCRVRQACTSNQNCCTKQSRPAATMGPHNVMFSSQQSISMESPAFIYQRPMTPLLTSMMKAVPHHVCNAIGVGCSDKGSSEEQGVLASFNPYTGLMESHVAWIVTQASSCDGSNALVKAVPVYFIPPVVFLFVHDKTNESSTQNHSRVVVLEKTEHGILCVDADYPKRRIYAASELYVPSVESALLPTSLFLGRIKFTKSIDPEFAFKFVEKVAISGWPLTLFLCYVRGAMPHRLVDWVHTEDTGRTTLMSDYVAANQLSS